MFYGDGVITPAISVLSAVEGLEVVAPALHDAVIPITLGVLTLLFAVQRFGTGGIGRAFGPVTLVWFLTLIALGLPHILQHPHVLVALNPLYAVDFFAEQPLVAFIGLGAVAGGHRRQRCTPTWPIRQAADPHHLVRAGVGAGHQSTAWARCCRSSRAISNPPMAPTWAGRRWCWPPRLRSRPSRR